MIYVYHSSQRAMVRAAFKKQIAADFPERDDLNYVEIDLTQTPSQEIVVECDSMALGYDRKAVVGLNAYFLEKKSKQKPPKDEEKKFLLEYLANPNPDVDLYFLVYSDTLDEKNEYYPLLVKADAKFKSIAPLNDADWAKQIANYFKKRDIAIDPDAVATLVTRIHGDYALFQTETEKLATYAADSKRLTNADVEALTVAPLEENAFLLANALTRGNKKEAFRIYESLKVSNVDEVGLLNLLANQFRFLNEVRYRRDQGLTPEGIASDLKCTPGRARASLGNLSRMNDRTCLVALEEIYQTEKDILTGAKQQQLAFSLFLVNFKLRP